MNHKTTPKDFFVQLGATIVLYVSVGALISLVLSIIDYLLPDQLAGFIYVPSLAWQISMLVVLVPIFYILEWIVGRDIVRMPEKRDIWIRRWRIYLTLFLMVALIGGDLIALINVYLNGEITARFIWKVLAILVIGAVIGKYYFFSIADTFKHARIFRKALAWFGILLVLAAIVTGFLVVGSPARQRAARFDSTRISDLANIEWQIVTYWQDNGALPTSLSDLQDSISGYASPKDPETGASYEYSTSGKTSFELCATFALVMQDPSAGEYTDSPIYPAPNGVEDASWAHSAGHACFDRTIDPSKYPVSSKSALQ